jgi:lipopolysaccharide biosynthesis protein
LVVSKPLVIETKNIAVMVHIFKVDIYDEIIGYLRNLLLHSKFDLYINLAINDRKDLQKPNIANFINKVRNQTLVDNCYFTMSDNKGLDIGGFLTSYLKMLELNLNYDSIIKIHTKTNENWRFAMLYALLGNSKIVQHNLQLIEKENIGIIGNQTLLIRNSSHKGLIPLLNHYMRKFKISGKLEGSFIPGTIFWIKGSVLKRYFTNKLLQGCYDEFKQNYCGYTDRKMEGLPHAFERLFGIMVSSLNKEVVKFDS